MNVTTEETKRFLKLVNPRYRGEAKKLLSNKNVVIINVFTDAYEEPYIGVAEACTLKSTGAYDIDSLKFSLIRFNSNFTSLGEDDVEFILSFISHHFKNLKLVFSSSEAHAFVVDISGMSASVHYACYRGFVAGHTIKLLNVDLIFQGYNFISFSFSDDDVEVPDDVWHVILGDRNNVNCILSAYAHEKHYFSDNNKKRIQSYYKSLSDSDKLLLELGENI